MNALEFENVQKSYGRTKVLNELSFTVPKYSICGLVGPNGAGKTTSMGIVGGYILPDKGRVNILGQGPFDAKVHAGRLTVLPQDAQFHTETTLEDFLIYYGRLQGLTKHEATKDVGRLLDVMGLADRSRQTIKKLSHGMRRRVAIAQSFLGSPELVLLDEPVAGLDPELVASIREFILSYRGKATLVISSHLLAELEAICDHVIIMEKGICTQQGPLAALTSQDRSIRVELANEISLNEIRAQLPQLQITQQDKQWTFVSEEAQDVTQVTGTALPALLNLGAKIRRVTPGDSLEQAYMNQRS